MAEAVRNRGEEALARCDWAAARAGFEAALAQDPEDAHALDGLGFAQFWLGEFEAARAARERAYGIHRRRGDHRSAAASAIYVGGDYRIAEGNLAAAAGWLARARRCLDQLEPCAEHGAYEIELARANPDPEVAWRHSERALSLARALGDVDFEVLALGQAGISLVALGRWEDGVALLDEAMAGALGGDATDAYSIGDACCQTLAACDQLVDIRRATEWCRVIVSFIERRNYVPLYAWCHSIYAGVLVVAGQWERGERELLESLSRFDRHGGIGSRVMALTRLAELRTRQGRLEEAARLLEDCGDSPLAVGPVARLRLITGDATSARALVERRLAALPALSPARAPLLAVAADAGLALGEVDAAAAAALELEAIANGLRRENLLALADVVAATVAAARGDPAVTAHLEAAVERFASLEMPYEAADARLSLAARYAEEGSVLAREEARRALALFERLGAARRADEAAALLRVLGDTSRSARRMPADELTARERDVLALLIDGLSNAEIAERLVISPKTAGHHVGHIFQKLGVHNRAEAVARALALGLLGRGYLHK